MPAPSLTAPGSSRCSWSPCRRSAWWLPLGESLTGGPRRLRSTAYGVFYIHTAASSACMPGTFGLSLHVPIMTTYQSPHRSVHRVRPPPQDPLLLALFASLPQLPPVPSLQYTAALMTGSYSGWLDASLQQGMQLSTVLQLLQMLVNGFGHHTTAPAATYALRNVCEACAGPLAPAMPMLGDLYQRVTTGGEGNLQEEEVQQVCERHVVVIVHVVVMYWLVC